ncbi:MAG: prepilin-type N-terminal cleavage/methylation domain-containing protein [Syntrophobacterales bacterium]|nr:prepilin-type N-terminal cleavage/methylation domain-containing protein [Syntrophobacterales bacterium]
MDRLRSEKNRVGKDVFCDDRRSGFTLIELIIAMAIGLLILSASYRVFEVQNKILKNQEQIVELQQNVRAAMEMVTREVRMAGYNPANVAFTGVAVSSSQLEIRADLDGNAGIAGQEYITYAFDSTNMRITRNIGASPQPFAENIEIFTYQALLDADGNVAALRITIRGRTALPDPSYSANGGYRTYELTSDVRLRNIAL